MKHKAELLAPPSAHELVPPSAASPSTPVPISAAQQRKKPHMLPPLPDKRRNSVEWRPRGSPPPAWRRPSLEDSLIPEDSADRPAVRVFRCPEPKVDNEPDSRSPGLRTVKYAPLEPIKRRATPAP